MPISERTFSFILERSNRFINSENSKPHVWQRRNWDNDVDLVAQSENPYRIGESKICQPHPQQRLPAKAFWDTVC
jgi:hypothetical protein